MSRYGRNEPCPCGSGKKYKQCCINKEHSIDPNMSLREAAQQFKVTDAAVSSHDAAGGIKELCLAQLEQISIYLKRPHKKDDVIQTICQDLVELAMEPEQKFITVWKEMYEVKGLSDQQIRLQIPRLWEMVRSGEKLTTQERVLLQQLMESNLDEYLMVSDMETMDYGAMLVLTELCYQLIKGGIPEHKKIEQITVYVGQDSTLDSWDVSYDTNLVVLKETIADPEQYIHIEWIALDEFDHEYESFVHRLHGLSDESKKALATVLYQEKKMESAPQDKLSYTGLVNYFTGIIEQEFRVLISKHNEEATTKKRMWKEICDYIKVNDIPYISSSVMDAYDTMMKIHPIRNKIAHGESVSVEDYQLVKSICLDMKLFDYISWAKVHYEDEDTSNK